MDIDTEVYPPLCNWMYFNHKAFTEPFFFDTMQSVRRLPVNKHVFRPVSSIEFLQYAAGQFPAIPPDVFIFHVSRCGSTLLAQMLSTRTDTYIAVSEPPLLDGILRLRYKMPEIPEAAIEQTFIAGVTALGRKRKGSEERFIIKTDAWHLFFYPLIRRLYPDTPFILLYRNPEEVYYSHQKQSGFHTVPGVLEPEMTGVPIDDNQFGLPWFAELLGRYFETMADIAAKDQRSVLLNYNQGTAGMMAVLEQVFGAAFPEDVRNSMLRRSKFHAKSPGQQFDEQPGPGVDANLLRAAQRGYERLEKQRLSRI